MRRADIYRINSRMGTEKSKSELVVITKVKDLCSYVFTVTEKSPKRFRFTLVSRMQNYCLDTMESLFRANEVYVGQTGGKEKAEQRLQLQHMALTSLKLLGYIAQLAMEQQCIMQKQYEVMTRKLSDCQNLTAAWINSDRKRYGS